MNLIIKYFFIFKIINEIGFVSLSTLTLMSIERYMIVSNPLKMMKNYQTFKTGNLNEALLRLIFRIV